MASLNNPAGPLHDDAPFSQAVRHERLLGQRVRILEMIVQDRPITETLSAIARSSEELQPASTAGITILDQVGGYFERAVFPSLPPAFASILIGQPVTPPYVGSCAASICERGPVTSLDLRDDGRFDRQWREGYLSHGIRSIQSRPALASDGTPLGAFALGFHEPADIGRWNENVMAWGAKLTGLALQHQRGHDRYELGIGEAEHRLRNVLTVVGAISQLTLRGTSEMEGARQLFERRLVALARSSALGNDQVDLHGILRQTLAPFRDGHDVEIAGPPLALSIDASISLALAIHELATNAAKYGSLSLPSGQLCVEWEIVRGDAAQELFRMHWIESKGPPVQPPDRSGFGRNLIEKSLAHSIGAKVTSDFDHDGFRCTILAPFTDKIGVVASEPARRELP